MSLSRRFLLFRLFPGLAGGAAASAVPTVASASATAPGIQKVVYHLSEPTRVNFVLGNIRNHIAGKGGPDKVRIVLVIHGPALDAFARSKASPDIMRQIEGRAKDGVSFVACGNTMTARKFTLDDMPEGFDVADEGGVTRIADLQAQGYLYIRP
ncbi:MAG: DsrE family protein [Rhizobium sp.]|nr:DsrE family protein [Rhizobium sp.]